MHAAIFDVPGTRNRRNGNEASTATHLALGSARPPAGRRQLEYGTTAPLGPHRLFPLRRARTNAQLAGGGNTVRWRLPRPRPRSTKKQISSSRRPPIRSIGQPADLLRSTIAAISPARVSFPSNSCRKRAGREQGAGARSARR
jgi:hypothetical protein